MQQTQGTQSDALPPSESSAQSLLGDYVDIINRALDRHADEFPTKSILKIIDAMTQGKKRVSAAIYTGDPGHPHDYFTLLFNTDRRLELVGRGKEEADFEWKLRRSYLEKVVGNPDDYIEHPMKIDWEWLKSRAA